MRLDHREVRDQRITAHVGLTSRALGASSFAYSGDKDWNLEDSLGDVVKRWGGGMLVKHLTRVRNFISNYEGIKIHLTMYGESHFDTINTLSKAEPEDLLIIVGGTKVPSFVYELADFNTSLGWQPHSEVSSVALFLYSLNNGEPLYKKYENAKLEIELNGRKARRSERFLNL